MTLSYGQPVFPVALGIAKVDGVGIAANLLEPVGRSIGALIVGKVTCRRYEYCLHVDIRTPAGVTATSDDIHRTNCREMAFKRIAGSKLWPSQSSPETVSPVFDASDLTKIFGCFD
jgi:hypothetical protein